MPNQATERALALAEADRLVLPFAMADARELLEALPSPETGEHAAPDDLREAGANDRSEAVNRAVRELRVLTGPARIPRQPLPAVAALAEVVGQGRMGRVPVELSAGLGRFGALIEQ